MLILVKCIFEKKKKAKSLKVNEWHTNTHTENVLKKEREAYYSKNENTVFIPNLGGLYPNEDPQLSMLQNGKTQ